MELVIILFIALFVVLYRQSNGESVYKFVVDGVSSVYDKYAPFSFKVIRERCKEMGLEYTTKQYTMQVIIFATVAFVISYLYFYNAFISIFYAVVVVSIIPYLAYFAYNLSISILPPSVLIKKPIKSISYFCPL